MVITKSFQSLICIALLDGSAYQNIMTRAINFHLHLEVIYAKIQDKTAEYWSSGLLCYITSLFRLDLKRKKYVPFKMVTKCWRYLKLLMSFSRTVLKYGMLTMLENYACNLGNLGINRKYCITSLTLQIFAFNRGCSHVTTM